MSFDHREAGTTPAAWLPLLDGAEDIESAGSGDHVVVVAAHPDDETLGAGGLIALADALGARVTVIVASDGEASHPESRTHTPRELARRRRREVRAAVAALSPAGQLVQLGLPDGRLAEHVDEITTAIDDLAAPATHLVTPWIADGHPDHEACARAAAAARDARRTSHWQFPIWAWHWADPESATLPREGLRRLPLSPDALAAKAAALECHASQHQPLSAEPGDEPVLRADMLAHFRRDIEIFYVTPRPQQASADYFDRLYEQELDPWGLADRFYEHRKRSVLLAALTRPRFRRAFEPGCATGLLTSELARRCDHLLAWDVADVAVSQTRTRTADRPNVSVEQAAIPDHWPPGQFDLVVLSEIGYYCADLTALTRRVRDSLSDDGVLVACHWQHPAPMHPQPAAAVHAALGEDLHQVVAHLEDDFLLHVWDRSGRSIAELDGIVE